MKIHPKPLMKTDLKIGIYPGTFDPITLGHIDIIQRALPLVDRLIIAVANNDKKRPLFPLSQRVEMIAQEIKSLQQSSSSEILIKTFDNLLVHFARSCQAKIIIRGLRAVSDFEYEFQMAGTNRKLDPHLETVFLMASENYQLISSRYVKDVARLGGEMSAFVSPYVAQQMEDYFRKNPDTLTE